MVGGGMHEYSSLGRDQGWDRLRSREQEGQLATEALICPKCGEPVVFGGHTCGDFQKLVEANPARGDLRKIYEDAKAIWSAARDRTVRMDLMPFELDILRGMSSRKAEEVEMPVDEGITSGARRVTDIGIGDDEQTGTHPVQMD